MSTNIVTRQPLAIPDSLWQTDLFWAEVYGISAETLNESWKKRHGLDARGNGNRTLYHRDDILLKVFGIPADAPTKNKKPPRQQ